MSAPTSRRITAKEARALLASEPRPHKYRAKAATVDGIRFASTAEANRWAELKLLQRKGLISDLKRQVRFALNVNGQHVCDYVADFAYFDEAGHDCVEDCKGVATDVYKLKAKLMKACWGIEIIETGRGAKRGEWVQRRGMKQRAVA